MGLMQIIRKKFLQSVDSSLKRIENRQEYTNTDQVSQLILKNQYKALSTEDQKNLSFDEIGFRKYSQNSEDGILLFIFSLIDVTNKKCVEICASDGIQSNTANLIINHGWRALLFDGNVELVNKGKKFYATHPDTFTHPPLFVHAWVTKDNVNDLISSNGFTGNIDLLSLDIDGVDYWVWDSLNIISPRVVVAEVQCIWGAEKSVTVPYQDDFRAQYVKGFGVYSGASLPAFTKLANKKGYRLIGIERYGFNAFFMRDDVGCNIFPEVEISSCVNTPFIKWAQKELLPLVKDRLWLEV
jgi:hypothetical protein